LSLAGRAGRLGADAPPRVGIIGGGLAGVSRAWLLDGVAGAGLFQGRPLLGGDAGTIPVPSGGPPVGAGAGAQFFADGTHPPYTKLLEVIGLQNAFVDAEMTITVTQGTANRPLFVSPATNRLWPIFAQWNQAALGAFFAFSLAAKQFSENGDWLCPPRGGPPPPTAAPAPTDGRQCPL